MTRMIARAAAGLIVLLLAMTGPARACSAPTCANGLAYQAYGPAQARILAVFVHGDVSAGGPADYMYRYAQSFAAGRRDVAAVALLRPGYYDSTAIVAVTGASDDNTRPALAEAYVERARAAGRTARLEIVAGGHGFGGVAGPSVRALAGMAR